MLLFYCFLIYDEFRGSVLVFDYTALPLIERNQDFLIEKIGKVKFNDCLLPLFIVKF